MHVHVHDYALFVRNALCVHTLCSCTCALNVIIGLHEFFPQGNYPWWSGCSSLGGVVKELMMSGVIAVTLPHLQDSLLPLFKLMDSMNAGVRSYTRIPLGYILCTCSQWLVLDVRVTKYMYMYILSFYVSVKCFDDLSTCNDSGVKYQP